ncbi:secretion-regulating guanine nucleotide exchange factor isoform X2 [Ascaphus truei]|uniref:secretion-regulating guanine nucleotide exchange factor isoform X2 n=1 Tax=Ascaphus truei TaxID=8439 RepID=UPI003F5A0BE5
MLSMACEGEPRRQQHQLLFAWGANSYGQLGLGNRNDVLLPQQLMAFPGNQQPIKSISGGGGHSAALTDAGELFVCGQNKDGQLGLNHNEDVSCFTLCAALLSSRVSKVACGWDFTVILTGSGELLSCGSNSFSQLGIPQAESCPVPKQLSVLKEKVLDVAAGLRHALALTESGQVFQWGLGLASHAKRASHGKPTSAFLLAKEPCRVPGLENVRGKKVTAGSHHSVVLTEAGDMYVWGSNKHGQLLHPESFLAEPQKVEAHFFSGERMEEVCSGWTHLVGQTETGKVFTWGRANYCQLGIVQDEKDEEMKHLQDNYADGRAKQPYCIPGLTGASQIACGSEHNLAVCGNELYSWGWNEHGMCGNGTETNVPVPKEVHILNAANVKLIGCGAGHSLILCITTGGWHY